MKIIFKCEICGESYSKAKDAILCERQGFHPKYEIREKVMHQGDMVEIMLRKICQRTHRFVYMFTLYQENYPPVVHLNAFGWINEDEFSPCPQEARLASTG